MTCIETGRVLCLCVTSRDESEANGDAAMTQLLSNESERLDGAELRSLCIALTSERMSAQRHACDEPREPSEPSSRASQKMARRARRSHDQVLSPPAVAHAAVLRRSTEALLTKFRVLPAPTRSEDVLPGA